MKITNPFLFIIRYLNSRFKVFAFNANSLFSLLVFSVLSINTVHAHRGAANEIDKCRVPVAGEVIHITAYTNMSGATGFCQSIPHVTQTDLVFDYEGKKLRKTTVEFEVTKEPEQTRIYYQEPTKIKKGTLDAKIDFSKYGAGDYLVHITVVHNGETLDSHLPFTVGLEPEETGLPLGIYVLIGILVVVLTGMVVMSRSKTKTEEAD